MASDGVVSALQLAHVSFNGALFFVFVFQGFLGWRIRRSRAAGTQQDFNAVRRHRALGPVLATLLPAGYLAGLTTTFLHKGVWVRFPGHLAAGTVLVAIVCAAVLAAKKIRGVQSPWRTPHGALGLSLLCAFLLQVFLGLDIFL
jgi:hypothetical protein